jgi:hypothetical protein
MRFFLLCFLAAISVCAQLGLPRISRFPPNLTEYLAVTEAQAIKISEQNDAFTQWSQDRSQRIYAVQFEILGETARVPLDPAALGVRYAEVEAIRREIAERNKKLIADNLTVLTPAQATKLKALEEALKLVSTASAAQSVKLLPDACEANFLLGSFSSTVIRAPLPGFAYPPSLCTPQPTQVIRSGNFNLP